MKKNTIVLLLAHFVCVSSFSQELIPLMLDSSFLEIKSVKPDGPALGSGGSTFYLTYDRDGRIEKRTRIWNFEKLNPAFKKVREFITVENFSYNGDTVFYKSIQPSENGGMEPYRFEQSVYKDGKKIEQVSKGYHFGNPENLSKSSFVYNNKNVTTLFKSERWLDNQWKNSLDVRFEYNEAGYRTLKNRLRSNSIHSENLDHGVQYFYDADNYPTRMIRYEYDWSWIRSDVFLISTVDWIDGGDINSTMLVRKHYLMSTGDFDPNWYHTINDDFEASSSELIFQDTLEVVGFDWKGHNWQFYHEALCFENFDEANSFLSIQYSLEPTQHIPNKKHHYLFEKDAEGNIYFEHFMNEIRNRGDGSHYIRKQWYQPKEVNYIFSYSKPNLSIVQTVFKAGELLKFDYRYDVDLKNHHLGIVLFDNKGVFVSAIDLKGRSAVQLPQKSGKYIVAVVLHQILIGYAEIMVE